jgi:UDP-N-acetylmuramate dehydrogenase
MTVAQADAALPPEAPRYPVTDHTRIRQIGAAAPVVEGQVKTSAAWLISHAGFDKGFGLGAPATLSTKHSLALTNRGDATAADLVALARAVQAGVRERFGIELAPEPVLLGVRL